MKISEMPIPVQFRKYALQLVDAPLGYEYGKESPSGADCSGLLSYPLLRMGWKIRTTANDFYEKLFTGGVPSTWKLTWEHYITAIFFVSRRPWYRPNGMWMNKGTAYHVAPVVGVYTAIHADIEKDAIYLIDTTQLIDKYDRWGYDAVWRRLNMEAVPEYDGDLFASIDPELGDIENFIDRGIIDE